MTVDVPLSGAYQLLVGRLVALEDRQELLENGSMINSDFRTLEQRIIESKQLCDERWLKCDEEVETRMENGQDIEKINIEVDVLRDRMDELWDALVSAYERMQWVAPEKKRRTVYPAHNGPKEGPGKGHPGL